MQKLRLFNSFSKKKEVFRPDSNKIGLYVCGITPYGVTHMGHAFTYTVFDVLSRYLRYLEYKITYVQNVTDIDDEIVRVSKEQNKGWRELGNENTNQFLQDMQWLQNKQPNYYVRASDHIPEMQEIIKKLIRKKLAYIANGSVYFTIVKYKDYGKLSKLSRENMLPAANDHGNNPNDPNKKDPLDFILWQSVVGSDPTTLLGEPSWKSPWGQGRPGWHIECSAMATKYLGQPFDIHGGGEDLIFPHHESEIAQSENAYGKPFVKYWMHIAMLSYQGEKMSKSLGNLVLIQNLKKQYSANAVRIALLLHHYRTEWECTKEDFARGQKLNNTLQKVWLLQSGPGKNVDFKKEQTTFFAAMNDDLDTPKALYSLEQIAQKMVRAKEQNITNPKAFLMEVFHILGLTMELRQKLHSL
jgi:cysteinyl-tRNA synthetase